ISTKSVLVAVEKLGHDPLRAVGVLLLELPGIVERLHPGRPNVFRLRYERRQPSDGWEFMTRAADRLGLSSDELWQQVRVDEVELARPVLDP
ncbi:MAG: hypothetical protein M3445_05295, partial [Actinomycetota bacterium]|nr:hypothetical protein [Actinomycetota bacterium]